jgi:hypothetical protein
MAYTLEQYNALVEAIATGALSIQYGGKTVTYRSLADMERLRDNMAAELGLIQRVRRKYADFDKAVTRDDRENH